MSVRSVVGAISNGLVTITSPGVKRGPMFQRYGMYLLLQEQCRGLDFGSEVLTISWSNGLGKLLGIDPAVMRPANYPEVSIHRTGLPDNSVSAVLSDQVFEHMSCLPSEAVAETYRILKPGGIAVHTTCFMTPYHGSQDFDDENDGDYWRYTASGLRRLHRGYSRVIAADTWGNPLVPVVTGLGLGFTGVPEAKWHPLNWLARLNRRSYGSMVWVVAQK